MTPRRLLSLSACALAAFGCQPAATPPTADLPPLSVPGPTDKPPAVSAVPAPAVLRPINRIVGQDESGYFAMDPDGKNVTRLLAGPPAGRTMQAFTLSPDGKTMAYLSAPVTPGITRPGDLDTLHLHTVGSATATEVKFSGGNVQFGDDCRVEWSPDSSEVLVSARPRAEGKVVRVVDAATARMTELTPPTGRWPCAYSPDGRGFVTTSDLDAESLDAVGVVSRDGKTALPLRIAEGYTGCICHLSPDGKNLLFMGHPGTEFNPSDLRLYVQPLGGQPVELARPPAGDYFLDFCWSGDAKRVAYTLKSESRDGTETVRLMVRDADGSGEPVEVMRKSAKERTPDFALIEWR